MRGCSKNDLAGEYRPVLAGPARFEAELAHTRRLLEGLPVE